MRFSFTVAVVAAMTVALSSTLASALSPTTITLVDDAAVAAVADDPCVFEKKKPFTAAAAWACIHSIPFSSHVRDTTLASLTKSYPLYAFLDIAETASTRNAGGYSLFDVPLMKYFRNMADKTYLHDYEFHGQLAVYMRALKDAHTRYYAPTCYRVFSFWQAIEMVSYVDASGEQIIQVTPEVTSELRKNAMFDMYRVQVDDYANARVLEINGEPALDVVRRFADVHVGLTKDIGTRFNTALHSVLPHPTANAAGKRAGIAGLWSTRGGDFVPYPDVDETHVTYTLKLETGRVVTVSLPWLASSLIDIPSRAKWVSHLYNRPPPKKSPQSASSSVDIDVGDSLDLDTEDATMQAAPTMSATEAAEGVAMRAALRDAGLVLDDDEEDHNIAGDRGIDEWASFKKLHAIEMQLPASKLPSTTASPVLRTMSAATHAQQAHQHRQHLWRQKLAARHPPAQQLLNTTECLGGVGRDPRHCVTLLLESDAVHFYTIAEHPKTVVMVVDSFEPKDTLVFEQTVSDGLAAAASLKLTDLIVDFSGNGGGDIILGRRLMRAILDPLTHDTQFFNPSDLPAGELAAAMASLAAKYSLSGTPWSGDSYNAVRSRRFPMGQPYSVSDDSWMLPPRRLSRTGQKHRQPRPFSQLIHLSLGHDYPIVHPNPKHIERVVMVSRGGCGSTCSYVSSHASQFDHITTVVVGGLAAVEEQQFWSFPGGQVFSSGMILQVSAALMTNATETQKSTLVPRQVTTTAAWRMCGRESYGPDALPNFGHDDDDDDNSVSVVGRLHRRGVGSSSVNGGSRRLHQQPIPLEYEFVAADVHMNNTLATALHPEATWFVVAERYFRK